MRWTVSNEDVFVRLDPGDEIHTSLQNLADEIGFDAATITVVLEEPRILCMDT